MPNHKMFVEPREDGGYRVIRENAKRASAVTQTQAEAIAVGTKLNGGVKPHVARVRTTSNGKPDQFRK
jgi:hypothetical protein